MIDYKKYVGKNIILASRYVKVVGIMEPSGTINGHISDRVDDPLLGYEGDGDWSMGWREVPINPYHPCCRRDGFIIAIEKVIIFRSDTVEDYDALVAKYGLRNPTLYDLL